MCGERRDSEIKLAQRVLSRYAALFSEGLFLQYACGLHRNQMYDCEGFVPICCDYVAKEDPFFVKPGSTQNVSLLL